MEIHVEYTWWNDGIENMSVKSEDGCKDWCNFGEWRYECSDLNLIIMNRESGALPIYMLDYVKKKFGYYNGF